MHSLILLLIVILLIAMIVAGMIVSVFYVICLILSQPDLILRS